MIGERDAIQLIDLAKSHGIEVRIDGGWGVDALLGRQTRPHNDIDLFLEKRHGAAFTGLLRRAGFAEIREPYTTADHTVWRDSCGRIVDLHLFEFGADGTYRFEGVSYPADTFGEEGRIAGRKVRCIPPAEQVAFHLGYEPDQNDRQDVRLLCERFGLPVPEEYNVSLKNKTE